MERLKRGLDRNFSQWSEWSVIWSGIFH